jgi:hypothetical protein
MSHEQESRKILICLIQSDGGDAESNNCHFDFDQIHLALSLIKLSSQSHIVLHRQQINLD